MMEKEVTDLEQKVKTGLGDSSLPFRTATKMIVEMGDVSFACTLCSLYVYVYVGAWEWVYVSMMYI